MPFGHGLSGTQSVIGRPIGGPSLCCCVDFRWTNENSHQTNHQSIKRVSACFHLSQKGAVFKTCQLSPFGQMQSVYNYILRTDFLDVQ